jgi:predicted DNA-binding protein
LGESITQFTRVTSNRLGRGLVAKLDAMASETDKSRGTLIREALEAHIYSVKNPKADLYRIATTTEFSQIVLDVLIKHFRPETYDQVLEHQAKRMEQYHAHP